MFKSIDRKFSEVGFTKFIEDEYGVVYERRNEEHHYTQVLAILHKTSGKHIIMSYDKDLFDVKSIGNTCVGLTYYETKLAMKKLKKLNRKWKASSFKKGI